MKVNMILAVEKEPHTNSGLTDLGSVALVSLEASDDKLSILPFFKSFCGINRQCFHSGMRLTAVPGIKYSFLFICYHE